MKGPNEFFTQEEIKSITQAIADAEKNTSAEICVHLDKKCLIDPLIKAKQIFKLRAMHRTKLRNAVLVYVSLDNRKFAVWGDKGINKEVSDDFWKDVCKILHENFSQCYFELGLIKSIQKIGEKLKQFFPYDGENDIDELSNELGFGVDN